MKKIVLILIVILLSNFKIVNAYTSNNISIFFANGMFTSPFKAKLSLTALENKLKTELPNDIDIKFYLSYNHNEYHLTQLVEVAAQKKFKNWSAFFNMLADIEIAPDWFSIEMEKQAEFVDVTNYIIDEDLQKHIQLYEEELDKGRKVIVVSHSQGNFYANDAYDFIYPDNFVIVAVATPADFVAGDGKYTTLTNDAIINAVRNIEPLTLPANTTNSYTEGGGHAFIENYLNGDISGPRIIGCILDEIMSKSHVCSDEITWVYIDDPGILYHEGFTGEMSKHEITNTQYCQYLNDALASGDIIINDDPLYNDVFGAGGDNNGIDYINHLYYDGNGSSYYTYFPELHSYAHNVSTNCGLARINYINGTFSVIEGFENHPVTLVSWYGAAAFCDYYDYRLPTEWEWQAVADYDGSYTYACGTKINNYIANYGDLTYEDGTTIAGNFGAYGYGMCDMSGNVAEWTSTSISGYFVIRGGGHQSTIEGCAVSTRSTGWGPEKSYSIAAGFRVCR